ncbi:GalNAc(5)-diNAcBac-PP-undecaprenol beta-1,3-glucosyltransferase [Thiorhodovibrio winogradskyi]|uniref:GalNAc(5)-diNAcBac-PP-undecaprenol beta-1,3-glucosyltransferase n=2 Tax=Thiorhodovibrio winogradskyi TaxID=77007 RepID=A0ABZ0SDL6_9GAMM
MLSIILPTYNRARFLPKALESICAQCFSDWELIIVDDGSDDDTINILGQLTSGIEQPVKIIEQENQGAYGARNTGLDQAKGKYVAFFDSDDEWLPHHLRDCVDALEQNPDVDWVYGACRIIDNASGEVKEESTFYPNGISRPFIQLNTHQVGDLRIINDDKAIVCAILHGFYSGLQNSVLRARVFDNYRFDYLERNEAEDQLFVIRMLLAGKSIGYLDNVHVNYCLHDANSSAAGGSQGLDRQERVLRLMIAGYEKLLREKPLPQQVRKALRKRVAADCFWQLGYATLWQSGQRTEARAMYRRGLGYWPWDWRYWKTYFVSFVK